MKQLLFIAAVFTLSCNSSSSDKLTTGTDLSVDTTMSAQGVDQVPASMKEKLDYTMGYLTETYFKTDEFYSADSYRNAVKLFSDASVVINKALSQFPNDKELTALANKDKAQLIAAQKKYYPRLRKSYAKFMKDKLWENDIEVQFGGTTITFIGGYFAANANIKETQESVSEMLTLLKFKQVNYRWYKGADEFTYYKLESSSDGSLD